MDNTNDSANFCNRCSWRNPSLGSSPKDSQCQRPTVWVLSPTQIPPFPVKMMEQLGPRQIISMIAPPAANGTSSMRATRNQNHPLASQSITTPQVTSTCHHYQACAPCRVRPVTDWHSRHSRRQSDLPTGPQQAAPLPFHSCLSHTGNAG